jgi:membrane-bound serine protease (ClpP class)
VRTLLPLVLLAIACLPSRAATVVAVDLKGVIHPITLEIVDHAVNAAKREAASAILIRLNTPGGLLEATRDLHEKLVASPVPVIVYVTPGGARAASAGFFVLQIADVAAMAPGTNTGAASPVLMGQQMDPVMRNKIENDTAAWLRSIAGKRGRNAELAEKTVREAMAFTEKEALEQNLIDLVAEDEARLFAQLNGRTVKRFDGREVKLELEAVRVVEYKPTLRERIVSAIADPNIGFILLVLGALGIYVEFTTPGLIVPGVAGGILALLGLSALAVLPINWLGVALLLLAGALFVLEAKFASNGILGAGGAVAMVLGAMLLVEGPPELRIRLSTALAVSLPFATITVFLVTLVVRARANKVLTGREGMIDEIGQALTALDPAGKVFVRGEYWDAVATAPVAEGSRIRVVALDGMRLRVEPFGNP